jgi:octaprenyl-diphosphate synthase
MNVTSQIKQPIFKEMELKKKFYNRYSQVALLNRIYSEPKRAQMRPMFVPLRWFLQERRKVSWGLCD